MVIVGGCRRAASGAGGPSPDRIVGPGRKLFGKSAGTHLFTNNDFGFDCSKGESDELAQHASGELVNANSGE